MFNWEKLYSSLKMTREGKDNKPLEDKWYIDQIKAEINIKNIEKMSKDDLQEAVISYFKVIVPGFH